MQLHKQRPNQTGVVRHGQLKIGFNQLALRQIQIQQFQFPGITGVRKQSLFGIVIGYQSYIAEPIGEIAIDIHNAVAGTPESHREEGLLVRKANAGFQGVLVNQIGTVWVSWFLKFVFEELDFYKKDDNRSPN